MYNEQRKQKYLNTITNNALRKNVFNDFERCAEREASLNKDIADFTKSEVKDFYTSLKLVSIDTLYVINYRMSGYTKWLRDFDNVFATINNQDLEDCIDGETRDTLILTRDKLLEVVAKMEPREAFMILAIFEGLGGKQYIDFYELDISAFRQMNNTYIVNLRSGRDLEISKELFDYAKRASEQEFYQNVSANKRINYEANSTKVIKGFYNTNVSGYHTDDEAKLIRRNYRNITVRLAQIRTQFNMMALRTSYLQTSGRIEMMRRMNKLNNTRDASIYVNTPEVVTRFGTVPSEPRWLMSYRKYL